MFLASKSPKTIEIGDVVSIGKLLTSKIRSLFAPNTIIATKTYITPLKLYAIWVEAEKCHGLDSYKLKVVVARRMGWKAFNPVGKRRSSILYTNKVCDNRKTNIDFSNYGRSGIVSKKEAISILTDTEKLLNQIHTVAKHQRMQPLHLNVKQGLHLL